jgi:transcriptional regulator with XRE-family HTH domain
MSSLRVEKVLQRLGQDIRLARKKRRIPVRDFAQRIGVAEGTVIRLEKGEPGTRIETLAMALLALGELARLEQLLDPASDDTGLMIDQAKLPVRIGTRRKPLAGAAITAAGQDSDDGTAF